MKILYLFFLLGLYACSTSSTKISNDILSNKSDRTPPSVLIKYALSDDRFQTIKHKTPISIPKNQSLNLVVEVKDREGIKDVLFDFSDSNCPSIQNTNQPNLNCLNQVIENHTVGFSNQKKIKILNIDGKVRYLFPRHIESKNRSQKGVISKGDKYQKKVRRVTFQRFRFYIPKMNVNQKINLNVLALNFGGKVPKFLDRHRREVNFFTPSLTKIINKTKPFSHKSAYLEIYNDINSPELIVAETIVPLIKKESCKKSFISNPSVNNINIKFTAIVANKSLSRQRVVDIKAVSDNKQYGILNNPGTYKLFIEKSDLPQKLIGTFKHEVGMNPEGVVYPEKNYEMCLRKEASIGDQKINTFYYLKTKVSLNWDTCSSQLDLQNIKLKIQDFKDIFPFNCSNFKNK